jgi:hypothetical protein
MRAVASLLLGLVVLTGSAGGRLPFALRCALVAPACAARPCCKQAPDRTIRSRMPCCADAGASKEHPHPTATKDEGYELVPVPHAQIGVLSPTQRPTTRACVGRSIPSGPPIYLRHRALLL